MGRTLYLGVIAATLSGLRETLARTPNVVATRQRWAGGRNRFAVDIRYLSDLLRTVGVSLKPLFGPTRLRQRAVWPLRRVSSVARSSVRESRRVSVRYPPPQHKSIASSTFDQLRHWMRAM